MLNNFKKFIFFLILTVILFSSLINIINQYQTLNNARAENQKLEQKNLLLQSEINNLQKKINQVTPKAIGRT